MVSSPDAMQLPRRVIRLTGMPSCGEEEFVQLARRVAPSKPAANIGYRP